MITPANLSKLGNIDYGGRRPFAAASVELRQILSRSWPLKASTVGGRPELHGEAEAPPVRRMGRTAVGLAHQRGFFETFSLREQDTHQQHRCGCHLAASGDGH